MSERDFSIGEKKFRLHKINAVKQFHIARRMAPMLGELVPVMSALAKGKKSAASESDQLEDIAKVITPVMDSLSRLSDKDADHVLYGLLAAVEIQQEQGNWAKLSTGDQLMFQDLELPVLIQCAGRAFMFNIAGFFSALPKRS